MFTNKLNKTSEPHRIKEEVNINGGLYEGTLRHDNIVEGSVVVVGGNGLPITTFTLEQNEDKEWETIIRIHTSQSTATIFYESLGDTVDADDVNKLNELIERDKENLQQVQTSVKELDIKVDKGTEGLKTLIEEHENDLKEVDNRLDYLDTYKASKDDLQADKIEYSPGWTIYDELGRKASVYALDEKAEVIHSHQSSDISGLDSRISDIWTAVNGKAFTSHTHMPTDIYLNSQGDKLSDISAKHIDFDGWNTVEGKLKSLQNQIDSGTGGGGGGGDISRVIPRITNTPFEDEITIQVEHGKAYDYVVESMSESVKREGNTEFKFEGTEGYSDLDILFTEGEGEFSVTFSDVEGYYSYTHQKVNGDRDTSGWIRDNKTVKLKVIAGDKFRLSTGNTMTVTVSDTPTTEEKKLYFEGKVINEDTDLTGIYNDIAGLKDDIRGKADQSHVDTVESSLNDLKKEVESMGGEVSNTFHDVGSNKVTEKMAPSQFSSGITLCSQGVRADFPSVGEFGVSITFIGNNNNHAQMFITGDGDVWSRRSNLNSGWTGKWYNSKKEIDLKADKKDLEELKNAVKTYIEPSNFTGDMDNLTEPGRYYVASSASNKPTSGGWFVDVYVANVQNSGVLHKYQVAYKMTGEKSVYVRNQWGGEWTDWQRVDGRNKADKADIEQLREEIEKIGGGAFHDVFPNSIKESTAPNEFSQGITLCWQSSTSNFPTIGESGVSITFIGGRVNFGQIFITNNGDMWSRRSGVNGNWSGEWYNAKKEIDKKANTHHTHYAHDVFDNTTNKTQVELNREFREKLDEVFQSGVRINKKLVDNLNSMGISASTSDSIDTNISKLNNIPTHKDWRGTVTRDGYYVSVPDGIHSNSRVTARVQGLSANKIPAGVTIGGVTGTLVADEVISKGRDRNYVEFEVGKYNTSDEKLILITNSPRKILCDYGDEVDRDLISKPFTSYDLKSEYDEETQILKIYTYDRRPEDIVIEAIW